MKFKIFTILLSALFFLSCNKTEVEIENEYLVNKVNGFSKINGQKWLVILPGLGCKGCIQEAEQFMKNNVKNKNVFFVLTKVESLKLLSQKTGINISDHKNIYVDRENYFNLPSNNTIYPLIIEMDKGEMKSYEFQSPKNGLAFSKLSEKLVN